MMVVPLPTWLLDVLLTVNLSLALVILLVTMYTREPLEFSIFPSLLLITTLFRLSLNVSSTRLILLHGNAGEVIQRFGEFVVGGSPVVGFIVFLILVVIQFIVITRGAERVAEVAARFTLDAMPGKQMSIDADLNAGLLTEVEARRRRQEIQQQADFYGAMDGASKFVKGDAIAAIIITVINLLGGFLIGLVLGGLSLPEAMQKYSLLTVGEGLVTQIPALLISTATGIVVTRAASDANLGDDVVQQLTRQPRVLWITGGLLGFLALVPGLPKLPFLVLAAVLGGAAYGLEGSARRKETLEIKRDAGKERTPESVLSLIQVDPVEIELGYGLLPLADSQQGGDLLERVVLIRRQLALELGLVVPPIRIRDNITQVSPNNYVIKFKGVEVATGEILPDHFLALNPGTAEEGLEGIPTTEPTYGMPALWVTAAGRERAELLGYTVVDPSSVLATHLTEVLRNQGYELLGRQEVKGILDAIKETHPAVVEELIPSLLTLGEVQKVLQNLLKEGISIRDLVTILETLADHAPTTRDPDQLTEYVRQALARFLARQFSLDRGRAKVLTLEPALERKIAEGIQRTERGSYLTLEPEVVQSLLETARSEAGRLITQGQQPIILCSSSIRPHLRRLLERLLPRLLVLSYNELAPNVQIEVVGTIG
ncbi:MAG: flagellar biosynthesis protein FlhA [Firmicutes bacterium]|nr:flagellar biosynthesis protein FlhA [Bacillota bacterium]MCL5039508.1 flagellar biosynthesis protein FlhA [Bacillota bacterium]